MDQAAAKQGEIDKFMTTFKNISNGTNVIRKLKNTITMPVWKQRRSSTNNMICGHTNCYANCEIDYESNIALDLKGRFKGSCTKCNHSLWDHHRCHSEWGQVTQVSVDQIAVDDDEKGQIALLDALREKVQGDLNRVIKDATNNLEQHVERYTHLSLSGNFSAQVSSAVRLLELRYAGLEGQGVDPDQLQKVKESLDLMQRKLDLLNKAKENARKERVERVGIGSQVRRFFGLLQ